MKDTKQIGDISETAAAFFLLKKGYSVSKPIGDNQRYDMIADDGKQLLRIQSKTGKIVGDTLNVGLTRVVRENGKYKKLSYDSSEIDAFVIYSPELDKCYLVKKEDAPSVAISLRLNEVKSNQKEKIRWACDYEI